MKQLIIIAILASYSMIGTAQSWEQITQQKDKTFRQIESEVNQLFAGKEDAESLRQYKRYMRWAESWRHRVMPDGTFGNFALQNGKALRQAIDLQEPVENRSRYGIWEDVTPTDFSPSWPANGRINAIAIHPLNSSVIFVGTVFGGLWKSVTGGNSWIALTDGLPIIAISDIAIDPVNTNTMYILTGDGNGRNVPSVGILKSTDGGATWKTTDLNYSLDDEVYGYNIEIDPNDPLTMLATTTEGIHKTTDGWVTSGIERSGDFRDVQYKPGSSDTAYATSANRPYRTVNGGDYWSGLIGDGGLPNFSDFSRLAVALTPADPECVYFLYTRGEGFFALYYSSDGSSFSVQSDTPNITGGQPSYDLDIWVDNVDPSKVYVGGVCGYKSDDFGVTWSPFANCGAQFIHSDIHRITQLGSTLYVGTDGGLSRTSNEGASWTHLINGLNIMQFYDIAIDGARIMGGTQDNGVNLWVEGSNTAESVVDWADGMESFFDPSDPDVIYSSTQSNRLRSDNGGTDWTYITPAGESPGQWTAPWIPHPDRTDTSYSANTTLNRTYDKGASWTDLNPPNSAPGTQIVALGQPESSPDRMYVVRTKKVLKTTNVHAPNPIWTDISAGLPLTGELALKGVAVDDDDVSKVFVSYTGYYAANKVWETDDGGATWTNITGSLPNVPVRCLVYDSNAGQDAIYAGTDIGVFYRNDVLGDWIYYSNGLPTVEINDLHIENGHLYAATYGRGVWKSELYSTCPVAWSLTPANDPSNPYSTGSQTYEASSSIVATRIIVGGTGTDVVYQAGNNIELNPGFEVKAACEFQAKVEGCSEN